MESSNRLDGQRREIVVQTEEGRSAPKHARNLAPEEGKGGVDFGAVLSTIRSGKWLILACVATATGAAVAYSMLATPTYEASAVVSVGARGSGLPGTEIVVAQAPLVGAEKEMLERSSDLPQRVYDTLREQATEEGTPDFYPLLNRDDDRDLQPAWESVADRMYFQTVGVEMIMIRASSSSPREAADLANFYAAEYHDQSRERSRASIVAARDFLESQVTQAESALDDVETGLETYSRERNIVAEGQAGERTIAEYTSALARYDDLRDQLLRARIQQRTLEQHLQEIQPQSATTNATRIQLELDGLAERIRARRTELDRWYLNDPSLRGNESREPQLQALKDDIDELERWHVQLERELVSESVTGGVAGGNAAEVASSLRLQLQQNSSLIRELEASLGATEVQIAQIAGRMDQIPGQMFDLQAMERRRENDASYLDGLKETLRQYNIAEQAELGFVEVVRWASVPAQPVAPDLRANVIMALLLGTFFGAGLAFLRSAINTQLQSPDDVEHLGYRLLGVIPSMNREIRDAFRGKREVEINGRVRSAALVTLHSPWSPASEHYRLVRTNVQSIAKDRKMKVILVTSPEPSDGKTVSAVNLAISLANNGSRTLIIDCDLRKASVARALGVRRSPGVGEMLTDGEAVPDFDRFETDIENLYCLPAGRITSPPPELLGSDTMIEILRLARAEFDVVIVDSPPVLAVTDAVVLAPFCDSAVVVVAANKTSPRAVRTTIATLENLGVEIAGVVFNQYDLSRSAAGYYGYQYGYAYAEESDS